MFKNSGKKIMGFVNFVFYLNLVVVLLAVVGVVAYVCVEYGEIEMILLTALAAVVAAFLYMLLLFFSLLSLYAFGELVQSNIEIKNTLTNMQLSAPRHTPQVYREPYSAPRRVEKPTIAEKVAPPVQEAPVPEANADPAFRAPAAPVVADPEPEYRAPDRPSFAYDYKAPAGAPAFPMNGSAPRTVLCPKCGGKHEPGAVKCRYCGTDLV